MSKSYRIILADDHAIFRAGLKSLIDKEAILKIVGEAKDGKDLLAKLRSIKCDLVVLDLSMPQMSGMEALQRIRQEFPRVKILVLTMQNDSDHFKAAMTSGAGGYLLKEDAYEQLVLAIKLIMKNKQYVSPSLSMLLTERYLRALDEPRTPSLEILTKRERQVLELIAKEFPNKNIAQKLKISLRTVETHRANLTRKLNIKSTAGLVKYAVSKGIE
ncbi:MAG: response regulator transcription factor [Candidatus Omnitrophota bacterium]